MTMTDNDEQPDETPSPNGDNGLEARDKKGRFVKGNPGGPGNPNARKVANWRQTMAQSVSDDDLADAITQLKKAARAGKPWAIRELLDRCLGKPAVHVELQAGADEMARYNEVLAAESSRLNDLRVLGIEDTPKLPDGGAITPKPPPP
jgi:hypothetical protein